ncbi:MAG: sugar ABC transporter substrate-binding protein [Lachnospiraceae bacterium]|nr:sugar ABC transporter substrate-binding protein [Lachnospiraceae bacterium]
MEKRKKRLTLLGIAALLLLIVGCVGLLIFSRNRNKEGEPQKRIGALYMTMNNPYFEVINEQVKAVVKNNGDVMITRDSAMDAEMQDRQIEELIEEGVDALLINAVDWKNIGDSLDKAKKAGVPIIAVDTEVYDDDLVDGTVISDNYHAGELCAQNLMMKRQSGKILFLVQNTNKSAVDRIQGFKDTLAESGWEYENVGELECLGQLEVAQPLVEEVLQSRQDIDVVMALNDPSALGAMAALDAVGMLSDVLVYGVDGTPEAKTMISEQKMTATAAQSPMKTGATVASMLYDLLDKKKIDKKTVLPVTLITEDNIEQFSLNGWE